jgi:hypothetical protein
MLHSCSCSPFYPLRVRVIATDGQSVCLSWCWAPFVAVWQLLSCPWEGALSDKRTGLSFVSQSAVFGQLSVCTIFIFYMCHMLLNRYTIYTRPLSVWARYSRLCPISGSFPIMAVWSLERSYAWLPPSLSLLYFLWQASPCPMVRTFSFLPSLRLTPVI